MIFIFAVFALGLAIAAFRTKERSLKIFLIAACLLNASGIYKAVATNDGYAFKLKPNDGINEPSYRK